MEATLTVEMDNAAFEGRASDELARILRKLAKQIEQDGISPTDEFKVMDINGNTVGALVCEA